MLEDRTRQLIAIEIKRALKQKLDAGFYAACQTINHVKEYIVYPGSDNYSFDEQIVFVSLSNMMKIVSACSKYPYHDYVKQNNPCIMGCL